MIIDNEESNEENNEENNEELDNKIIEAYNYHLKKKIEDVIKREYYPPKIESEKENNIVKGDYNLFNANLKLNGIFKSINDFDKMRKKENISCENANKFTASKLFEMYNYFCDNTWKEENTNNKLFCEKIKELKRKMEEKF